VIQRRRHGGERAADGGAAGRAGADRRILALWPMVLLACAHSPLGEPGPREDAYDHAYQALRLREEGCTPERRTTCCDEMKRRLDRALAEDDLAIAAGTTQALAIGCRPMRAAALAAMDHQPKQPGAPTPGALEVRWAPRLGSGDRIYWASALIDRRFAPGAHLPAGPHLLDVEAHIVSTSQPPASSYFRVRAQEPVVIPAGRLRVLKVVISYRGAPSTADRFEIVVGPADIGDLPLDPPRAETVGTEPGEALPYTRTKEPGMRLPPELHRAKKWSTILDICATALGRVDTVTPLLPAPHARHLGLLLDWTRQFHYESKDPGRPLRPFCHPLRIVVLESDRW
jgi:hypothetical protein